MNINVNTLRRVIKRLTRPTKAGEVHKIQIPDRVGELTARNKRSGISPSDIAAVEITLVSVEYRQGLDCWCEWELVI